MKNLDFSAENTSSTANAELYSVSQKALVEIFNGYPIANVLLVNPPDVDASSFSFDTCKRGRYTNYEPYGLGVLASHLRSINIDVNITNLNNAVLCHGRSVSNIDDFDFEEAWYSELDAAIKKINPDLIAVTCLFSQTHPVVVKICRAIARLSAGKPIAIGGVHVTNALASSNTRATIQNDLPDVSFFFLNECDIAFKTFVLVVNGCKPLNHLAQVTIRYHDQFVVHQRQAQPNTDALDVIPAHDLMNPVELSRWGKVGSYFYLKSNDTRFATVLSNRGCRAQCSFSSVRNFNGTGVRRRSVRSVLDELKMLSLDMGVRHIMWLDDDFFYDTHSTLDLLNGIVRENIPITWDCTNGVIAAACKPEVIAAAAASGCIGLTIGMESGNPEILRKIKKPGTVKNFLEAASILRRYPEIYTRVYLIIGFPGETFSQITDTVSVSREMGLDWYQIQVLQPLPNTPIFDRMVSEGLILPDEFGNVSCTGGTFGKNARAASKGKDPLTRDFVNALKIGDSCAIPNSYELEDIWAYMVYHLNYEKLKYEARKIKQVQYLRNLEYISDVVALDDAFALHYRKHLLNQLSLPIPDLINARLRSLLANGDGWRSKFLALDIPLSN